MNDLEHVIVRSRVRGIISIYTLRVFYSVIKACFGVLFILYTV